MKTITIKHFKTGRVIFSTPAPHIKAAVEKAVAQGVSLAFADLRHANLANARMDGALLNSARMDEANLTGANMSESVLYHASLANAQLHSAVLCEARLHHTNFRGALFGGTDIGGAHISHCQFDTLSALDLNFIDAAGIQDNIFISADDFFCRFSRPPLTLKGLSHTLAYLDRRVLVGLHALADGPIVKTPDMPSSLYTFMNTHRHFIEMLLQCRDNGRRLSA